MLIISRFPNYSLALVRYSSLLALVCFLLVACDSSSTSADEPTPEDVWPGSYSGTATSVKIDGASRTTNDGLTSEVQIAFDGPRALDSVRVEYEGERGSGSSVNRDSLLLLTTDTLVTHRVSTDFGSFLLETQTRVGRDGNRLSGVLQRVYTQDENDVYPDTSLFRFTATPD